MPVLPVYGPERWFPVYNSSPPYCHGFPIENLLRSILGFPLCETAIKLSAVFNYMDFFTYLFKELQPMRHWEYF
jgi:hypothetical protein